MKCNILTRPEKVLFLCPAESGRKGKTMEKVKFGATEYELPVNGYRLNDEGGKVIFLPGSVAFDAVEAEVKAAASITVLDSAGDPWISRTDLIFAGYLAKDDNYVIGADPEQGTDITGTVLIAEFRLPDVREELAAVKAQLDYVTMMSDIPMEV